MNIDKWFEMVEHTDVPNGFYNAVDSFERVLITKALKAHNNSRTQAAKALGLKRTTLVEKLKKWGIKFERREIRSF